MAKSKPSSPGADIIEAIRDPRLIGDDLSEAQETALRALYGLPFADSQLTVYQKATDRAEYAAREYREASIICGRRSGKSSKIAANVAVYEAALRPHPQLARGERAHIVALAPTQRQASVTFDYISARLENSPTLRGLIENVRADEIDLSNRASIAVWPCNFRSIRGLSIACCVAEEVGFWRDDEGANPADAVLAAIRPAMATFAGGKLLKVSSPWAKSGVLWRDYQRRLERVEPFVWKLPSWEMNPSLDPEFLKAERERDEGAFLREYAAEFYESASAFLPSEAVEACIARGRPELPPQPGTQYWGALDAAFRGDCFAFAIVHRAGQKVMHDFIYSWRGSRARPVNLAETLGEIVTTLRAYGISKIFGDQFCSEPIKQALAAQGIRFEQATTLGSRAAGIWCSLRTLVTSGQIELLDDAETIGELKRLELIVTSGGNQRIEASSGHDDRSVALALAAHQAVVHSVGKCRMYLSVAGHGRRFDIDENPPETPPVQTLPTPTPPRPHPANVPRFWPRKTYL
jgi:hypothetical protein